MFPIILIVYIQAILLCSDANTSLAQQLSCRTERKTHLLYNLYRMDTCARCYLYMPPSAFKMKFLYVGWSVLLDPLSNLTHEADPSNASQALLDSFSRDSLARKWKACCLEARRCCHRMISHPSWTKDGMYCPRTWDGWQCWPDTPAGTTALQPCLDHIYFDGEPPSCEKFALKTCWPNGSWYQIDNFREWSNYSSCGRIDDHRRFLYYHMATYAVSVVFIVPALTIFMIYKQLQVHRITMHKNLFLSLFFNGVAGILFKGLVIMDELYKNDDYETVMQQNGPGCRLLYTLTKYFRMTNYMWMFCEGFYLHKLIAAAFAEQKNLFMFYVIGWVFPILPTFIYAILRLVLENGRCWAFPVESYEWIVNAPNLLSLLANLFFLCNIIRVLVTKLRTTHSNEPSQYRKAVRATLVLFPLFGLNFCLIIYRPHSGHCAFIEVYAYITYTLDGLQGFLVALIFCYLNGEVLYLLKRSYQKFRLHQQFQSSAHTSIVLMRNSTTQVSTVNESHTHHLYYRTKNRDHKSCEDFRLSKDEDSEEDIV